MLAKAKDKRERQREVGGGWGGGWEGKRVKDEERRWGGGGGGVWPNSAMVSKSKRVRMLEMRHEPLTTPYLGQIQVATDAIPWQSPCAALACGSGEWGPGREGGGGFGGEAGEKRRE